MTYKPLDQLIESKGLKYSYVATELGISSNGLWRMRVDLRRMDIEKMEKLGELLGVGFMEVYKIQKKFRQEVDKNTTNKQLA